MKYILFLLFFPLAGAAQQTTDGILRARQQADSTHFPDPFEFSMTDTSSLPPARLYAKCLAWMKAVSDTLQHSSPTGDLSTGNIMTTNIPATTDISCDISVKIGDGRYTCRLHHYLYHSVNIRAISVGQAAAMKEYRRNVLPEQQQILTNHTLLFRSLKNFVHA